jgi:hypothetical protein
MAIKEPLASSANSQMTGNTLQVAGPETDNGHTEKPATGPAQNENGAPPAPTEGWKSDAPNGGARAWLVVLGAWCTAFCSFGWLNSKAQSASS